MGRGTLRVLMVAVVAMGVLIVAGTATLIALVAWRRPAPQEAAAESAPAGAPAAAGARAPALLDEPAGTRIASASGTAEALVLLLSGGGPDRVVVVDARSGAVLGRAGLAR